ncbi:hypothetical protein [Alkalicoccus halolimnae]|uniref:Uncharacterized protein n=1 Tax=Alkalicoccus halolimnae TaxID=1667239 RepID=A0A5C7F945_9BACI|nr:hypothetical protein [Alkalicoccus halolimnae]TXF81688.1 hypothetical protein FTX54_15655 [Alkalicoccus halolimnae]
MRKPWRSFLLFILAGLGGTLLLIPLNLEVITAALREMGTEPENLPSTPVLALLSLINPMIIILLAVTAGHLLARSTGLTSLIYIKDRDGKPASGKWRKAGTWGGSQRISHWSGTAAF